VRSIAPDGQRDYIGKRTRYATDIIRRLTDDYDCRERQIWQHGLLDCLPVEVESPMVAYARDGDGWALLMRDESTALQKLERQRAEKWTVLSRRQVGAIVDALASMHARFYADPVLSEPALGLCTGYDVYGWLHPSKLERETTVKQAFLDMQRTGWRLLDRLPADLADSLAGLHEDPAPLVRALARYPSTLVHGDPKRENLGLTDHPTPRLVLIDWQFVAALPPAVDLGWMLQSCSPIADPKEGVIDRYHAQLSRGLGGRFDEGIWEPQLRLALLGQTLRRVAFMLWAAYHQEHDPMLRDLWRAELPWWCEHARAGLKWL
jgi:hypothetical protein